MSSSKRVARGVELPYGYRIGDLVEVKTDAGEWVPGRLVGTHRRQLCSQPLADDGITPWTYSNPARVRRLTPERLEAWLQEGREQ